MKVHIFANTKCELGEGVHWNLKRQSLLWVDIFKNLLFEKKENEELKTYILPCMATATFEHKDKSIVYLVTEQGVATFDLHSHFFKCIVPFDLSNTLFRTNDAGVDPYGNIVFSTMERTPNQRSGAIYRINSNGSIEKILSNIRIPNTLRWTTEGNRIYLADSYEQEMYQFQYNKNSIEQDSKENFFSLKNSTATPDGSAISTDGTLWNAQWDGFCVKAYNLFGNNIHTVTLPVPRPTSCTFGGKNHQYLFITTARAGLNDEQLLKYPESGAVFMLKTQHSGCDSVIPII